MHADFWLDRWHTGRIGFHQDRPNGFMVDHWSALDLPAGSQVFVPLCGKSLDMAWLAAQGHRVLGVELSRIAVEQFFAEHGLQPEVTAEAAGERFVAGGVEIICGDAFALTAAALEACRGVYDRAALIALPPAMRDRYVNELYARLPSGCRGLLVTLEYPQEQKAGPPFPVDDADVHARFDRDFEVRMLERRDILHSQPAFADEGVTSLHTAVYRIERR